MSVSLNALDSMESLLWTSTDGAIQGFSYTPFGSTPARGDSLLPGFNGERLDPVSQSYHLGNGYRTYNPVLMRFNAPDSWSPFGTGGLNQYAYCEGDPINRADPSGHLSGQAWAGIAFGILGVLLSVVSAGISIGVAGGVDAALMTASSTEIALGAVGATADVSAIASGATSESDPKASQIIGWMSFALGLVGAAAGIAHAGSAVHAKFKRRMGATNLLSDERQPLMHATPDDLQGPFDDAGLPGPSSRSSSPNPNVVVRMPDGTEVNLVESVKFTGSGELKYRSGRFKFKDAGIRSGIGDFEFDADINTDSVELLNIFNNSRKKGALDLVIWHLTKNADKSWFEVKGIANEELFQTLQKHYRMTRKGSDGMIGNYAEVKNLARQRLMNWGWMSASTEF